MGSWAFSPLLDDLSETGTASNPMFRTGDVKPSVSLLLSAVASAAEDSLLGWSPSGFSPDDSIAGSTLGSPCQCY